MTKAKPAPQPFWKTKTLREMSPAEWESLCDGCGRCCMNKIEDEDTGEIYLTKVACKLLDIASCRCSDYPNRKKQVPDCIQLTPKQVDNLTWLPTTCAYRLVAEGADLHPWHPLISGDPDAVHSAGISVRKFALSERKIPAPDFAKYIVKDFPKPAKSKVKSKS